MIVKQIIGTLILICWAFNFSNAQGKYFLKLTNNEISKGSKKFSGSKQSLDSINSILYLQVLLDSYRNEGYLTASLDSIVFLKDTAEAYLTIGQKFRWVNLEKGNVTEKLLRQAGWNVSNFDNKEFSVKEFNRLQNSLITIAENQGNPFASLKLDSIRIVEKGISASLNLNLGPVIYFDSLTVVGSAKVKPKFMERYLNIEKGILFQYKKISSINHKISEFPSLEATSPHQIEFGNNKAYPIVFLNHRPANIIDGIIGFLPNETMGKKLLITGQFNLNLYNIGGTGKDLMIEWNKLKPLSQLLNFQFNSYNFLQTGLDFETRFYLIKEDSSFINTLGKIGIAKPLENNLGRIRFFSEIKNSRIGSISSTIQKSDSVLADFNLISYGAGYAWSNLNDNLFPRKGFKFTIDGQIGNKIINRNEALDSSFYKDISRKTIQSTINTGGQGHFKISNKSGLYGSLTGGVILNDQIMLNDMFRIGGLKTLRGFNENYFFASKYLISNLEYRYFYEEGSYFVLFYDQGFLTSEYLKKSKKDSPSGIGGGLNLKTNVGTLQLIYSLGKSKDQPLNFNYSKIHFGIISRF